ncbi:MAG: hypothetical protein ACLQNE_01035 [Thermoguttaceae bacterium]|jgi:hypothetical protein
MKDFGKGPTLEQASPYLQERAAGTERILEAAERDSVIEGLPPFSEDFRQRLREELNRDGERDRERPE